MAGAAVGVKSVMTLGLHRVGQDRRHGRVAAEFGCTQPCGDRRDGAEGRDVVRPVLSASRLRLNMRPLLAHMPLGAAEAVGTKVQRVPRGVR